MVSSTSGRAEIHAELIAKAEKHIAEFDGYTASDAKLPAGVTAKYTMDGTNRLTVSKYRAAGLTIDKVRAFYDNNIANASKLNPKNKMSKIDDSESFPVYHTIAELPWPMSNRSTISVTYRTENSGILTVVSSSRGTEDLAKKHAGAVGKNVLANLIIQFARFIPVDGGMDIVTVICADPAGSIPDGMKTKQAGKHALQPHTLANFMLTGAVPAE